MVRFGFWCLYFSSFSSFSGRLHRLADVLPFLTLHSWQASCGIWLPSPHSQRASGPKHFLCQWHYTGNTSKHCVGFCWDWVLCVAVRARPKCIAVIAFKNACKENIGKWCGDWGCDCCGTGFSCYGLDVCLVWCILYCKKLQPKTLLCAIHDMLQKEVAQQWHECLWQRISALWISQFMWKCDWRHAKHIHWHTALLSECQCLPCSNVCAPKVQPGESYG